MTAARPLRILALLLLAASVVVTRAQAQSPVDPGKLPARTTFYLLWRGTPSGDVRTKNALYSLWDDPDVAPARSALLASMLTDNPKSKDKPKLSSEEASQYLSLLDNPFLVGYIRRPESAAAAKASTTPATKPAWNGLFLIYDRTGKEELLSKAVLRMRGSETEIPKLSTLTVSGVSALKIERKNGVNYWAEFGKYAVSAQELPVFEEILNVLNDKPAPASLSQSSAFIEAKPLLSGGLVEFFLNISHLKDLALEAPAGGPTAQFKPFLSALKLEALHSIAGHIVLEGAKTRVQAAILGDTVPGSLFDVFASGQPNPASLSFVSPDTIYYSESQVDLLGLYKVIKRAFAQASGNSAQQINLLESAATTRLGMPIDDALGLTTGEIASLQTSPAFDDNEQVYFLGIRNKPDSLKLLRTTLGDRITSERNVGSTTFLKVSLQGGQSTAGVAQWHFYHLAMTSNAVLGAAKEDTLHKYLDRAASASPDSTAASTQRLQALRAGFPEKLNGLTFFDLQKVDWPALKAKWIADAKKAAQTAKSTDTTKSNPDMSLWFNQLDPQVFPRHLHSIVGAAWKDAKGAHFEEWLE